MQCMLHLRTIDAAMHDLLVSLSAAAFLDGFALAGGTSLALQIGHRKSIDIDMFAHKEVDMPAISLELENSYSSIVIRKTSQVFIFCHINTVKCDFVKHSRYRLISPIKETDGIRMYSIEDIAAMKLNAICGRGGKKDFYDIYFLLQQFPLKELLSFYDYKFQSDNSWMALRSLQYFEDADEQPAPELIADYPSWSRIKSFLENEVKKFKFNA